MISLFFVVLIADFVFCCIFFFFKQKTAYEMRISDWSPDVCSSDLGAVISSTAFIQYSRFCGLRLRVSTTVSRVIISRYSRLTPAELTVTGDRRIGCSTISRPRDTVKISSRIVSAQRPTATDRQSGGEGKGVAVGVDIGGRLT